MEKDPYQNPWLRRFGPREPAPSLTSEVIAQYPKSLEPPYTPPPLPNPPSSLHTSVVPERSLVEKIADANSRVRKAVADGKLNRAMQTEWVGKLLFFLRPLYGKKSALIAMLEQLRKDISKSALSTDAFVSHVQEVEHFLVSLNAPAASGSFVVSSQPSLVPATKNVFVIHGRDEVNQLRLSKLLREDFNLSPVVLLDKPGRSAPTIEKFEQHAKTCGYAIALFTADDKVTTKAGDEYLAATSQRNLRNRLVCR